jgi:hypothetical protein
MTYPEGEGPIDDPKAARERARAALKDEKHTYKPDHAGRDPRDVRLDEADLDDAQKQERGKP